MNWSGKTVVACYTTDGKLVKIYRSAKDAARCRNLHPRTIDKCIRGENVTIKGLQWRRFPVGEVPETIDPVLITTKTYAKRPIAKVDDEGKILEVYPSIRNAAIKNKIDPHTLRDRMSSKYRLVGKTKFRYLTDEEIYQNGLEIGHEIDITKKAVIQYSIDGKYIATFKSIREATIKMGRKPTNRGIADCLSGRYSTAFGYVWKYKNLPNVDRPRKKKTYIYALDKNFKIVTKYDSVKEAATTLGVSVSSINNAIRLGWKVKGYNWKRK